MSSKLTRSMPAHETNQIITTTDTGREGVRAVALFRTKNERKRAWDELSETDRAVLLESVRQRREQAAARTSQDVDHHGVRAMR